jgi:transposase
MNEKDLYIKKLEENLLRVTEENTLLKEEVNLLKLQLYGRSSEKKPICDLIFNEAEKGSDQQEEVKELNFSTPTSKGSKSKGRQKRLNTAIPRKEHRIELPKDSKCKCSEQASYVKIGEEIRERLNIIPAKFEVNKYIECTYKCSCCGDIVKAKAPKKIIQKGDVDNGLLTEIIIGKYENHAPLYRFEEIFERLGVELSRNTTSRWVIQTAKAFEPIINLMKEDIRDSHYVQCDETSVQVLQEKDRAATSKSYMWVLRNAETTKPMTLFTYEPSRSGETALNILDGIKGAIQTDGYKGYNGLDTSVEHLACWAHARRKFHDAVKAANDKKINKKTKSNKEKMLCEIGLQFITLLYRIDRVGKKFPISREKRIRKLLEYYKNWLGQTKELSPPKGLTGRAIAYTLGIWDKLERTALNKKYHLDNNLCENAIRPFAIGRRNWLFACSEQGAAASANIYSLIESAKANGINSRDYIYHLLEEIPKATTVEDFEKLLPYKCKPPPSI